MSASDQLRLIDEAYAETTAASNERVRQLMHAQAQAVITREASVTADAVIAAAGHAAGTGTAHDATVKTESTIAAELTAERDHLTQAAIKTLIDTVAIGQGESARAAEKLNDMTAVLVKWTRVIGWATIAAVVVGIVAVVVALGALIVTLHGAAHP